MNAAVDDEYKLLTQDEHEKLFGVLEKVELLLESLPKITEEPLPDTNESPQANNDLPERIEQQVENFNSSVKEAYNLLDSIGKQVDEFNTAIENFSKSIDGKIQELNNVAENFSKTVQTTDELQKTLKQFTAQKNSWQEMFDKFAANVQTFKKTTEYQNTVELEQLKTQCDEFKSKRDSVQADKQRLEGELRTKIAELDDKQRTLGTVQADKQRLEGELRTKIAELDDKRRSLEVAQADKQRLEGELRTKTTELDNKQRTLESIRGEFKKLEAQTEQAKESVQSIKNIFKAYEPVLAALKNCQLFSEYVNEHDLTTGDSKALFRLARTMGETSDFANEIHSIAVEAKKNSKEPMTVAEGTVYKAISRCYAEIWNIDFDIFICPGEQSTDKPYTTTNFNRSDMINLLDPRDKVSKYAQEVYVPLLRTKNRGLISQARVKAGNDMK